MESSTDPVIGERYELHPMKGPMKTLSMKGLKGIAPLHWLIYNIDGAMTELPENLGTNSQITDSVLSHGASHGLNSFIAM